MATPTSRASLVTVWFMRIADCVNDSAFHLKISSVPSSGISCVDRLLFLPRRSKQLHHFINLPSAPLEKMVR